MLGFHVAGKILKCAVAAWANTSLSSFHNPISIIPISRGCGFLTSHLFLFKFKAIVQAFFFRVCRLKLSLKNFLSFFSRIIIWMAVWTIERAMFAAQYFLCCFRNPESNVAATTLNCHEGISERQ